MTTETITAEFSQSRNDLHWSFYAGEDGFVRWTGYDDNFWWHGVSNTDHCRNRVGKVTGKTYRLDPRTHEVTVA